MGTVKGNESFVHGSSFDYGFNIGIGVFGTNHLLLDNNVIYHTVGSCMDVEGNDNKLIRNMMVYSVAMFSYKVGSCFLRVFFHKTQSCIKQHTYIHILAYFAHIILAVNFDFKCIHYSSKISLSANNVQDTIRLEVSGSSAT